MLMKWRWAATTFPNFYEKQVLQFYTDEDGKFEVHLQLDYQQAMLVLANEPLLRAAVNAFEPGPPGMKGEADG